MSINKLRSARAGSFSIMIDFFRFASLEEYDGRVAVPTVIPDLAHERLALLADEHAALVDVPSMEIDPLAAVGGTT